jgi:hypothetical protein
MSFYRQYLPGRLTYPARRKVDQSLFHSIDQRRHLQAANDLSLVEKLDGSP